MGYIPHTDADREAMLRVIGAPTLESLFDTVPPDLRLKGDLGVASQLDEYSIVRSLSEIAASNHDLSKVISFLGAGIYEHYSPSVVTELIQRGEFLSAYTPYQPEVSQGYLQTIYEFQSMICEITGMDVANASMYDGATALAEAAVMCVGFRDRGRIVMSNAIHPHSREVVFTFLRSLDVEVVTGDTDSLNGLIDDETAAVLFAYPDFFGRVMDYRSLLSSAQSRGAMTVCYSEPISLGVLEPPGTWGVDVVVGDMQGMGIPMGFGGPLCGYFCVKRDYIRAIPGRIVGRTHDDAGRRGYVMTLRTREQDIRREKATSNICTNQALMALASTVWMSALGKTGFRKLSESCVRNAHYAADLLCKIPGVSLAFPDEVFAYEFALDLGRDARRIRDLLLEEGFLAGLPLGDYYTTMSNMLLVAVTEVRSKSEIESFVDAMSRAMRDASE